MYKNRSSRIIYNSQTNHERREVRDSDEHEDNDEDKKHKKKRHGFN